MSEFNKDKFKKILEMPEDERIEIYINLVGGKLYP